MSLTQWSYSRLVTYETCPWRAKLQYIDRLPEPPRLPPEGRKEHPLDRGTRIHELLECYLTQPDLDVPEEVSNFEEALQELKQQNPQVEGDWAFNISWVPVSWTSQDVWLRAKLDAFVIHEKHAQIIDFKTGKRYGNEIKHGEQGQLYMIAAAHRYPDLESFTVEFWYTDLGERSQQHYGRQHVEHFTRKFEMRALKMSEDTLYKPRPNKYSCKWCPYRPEDLGGTGACEYAWRK